ncbi:UNVERIFIED_CONTAM: hypothetical protein I5919_15715 [Aeromonas hydrophila]|nr:hypothetical protein [Aeromonas hydrophila]
MLGDITFGDRVAENEAENLASYFVETQPWMQLYSGKIDVVFGSKGAGKSALYTLLLNKRSELLSNNIFLVSAEKPTGQTVFTEITNAPPTSESEFVTLWKVYFCQLIVDWLKENSLCDEEANEIADKLIEAGLIQETNTLKRLVNSAKQFAKSLMSIESLEGGLSPEGLPTGKITFRTPTPTQQAAGFISVDEMLEVLNIYLKKINKKCWILCDRLDVAFDQSPELEKNALRALFKTYRDIEEYDSIFIKVFLRDDIWTRITKDGFREASHITRTTTITWDSQNLFNLIISRALKNPSILKKYNVSASDILSSHEKQHELYYKMFPLQVDVGVRQSDTFQWILSRVRDGLLNTPPRELIHYYNESISQELKEQEVSNNKIEEPNIVSRAAIKNAAYEVSKVRMEQTLFAEYPEYKDYIKLLENKKAEHNIKTLSDIWGIKEEETQKIAIELAEIGFFDLRSARNEKIYKIPFMYRFYLNITQGKAF